MINLLPIDTYRQTSGNNGNVCRNVGRKFGVRFSGNTWLNFNLTPYCDTADTSRVVPLWMRWSMPFSVVPTLPPFNCCFSMISASMRARVCATYSSARVFVLYVSPLLKLLFNIWLLLLTIICTSPIWMFIFIWSLIRTVARVGALYFVCTFAAESAAHNRKRKFSNGRTAHPIYKPHSLTLHIHSHNFSISDFVF